MGTQDRPAGSVFSGPFSHNIFLLVVVDRRNETWLGLLRWSVERPNPEAVRLGTAGKHDALEAHCARRERRACFSTLWHWAQRFQPSWASRHRQRRPDRSPYQEMKKPLPYPHGP